LWASFLGQWTIPFGSIFGVSEITLQAQAALWRNWKWEERVKKLLLILAALAAMPAGANAETFTLVTSSDGTDPFWPVVNRGAEDAAKLVGATVDIRHPNKVDPAEMVEIMDAAIAQHPDGIVVSNMDGNVIGPAIRRAVDAGIPVVTINSNGEAGRASGALFHVGQPEFQAGQRAGKQAKALGVTKHFCILAIATLEALRQRCRGYADGLGVEPNIIESGSEPAEIKARTSAYLASHPDINGIVSTDPFGCPPVHEAIVENGLEGKVVLSCFDMTPNIIKMIKDGTAAFTIDQQQYLQGYLPIIALDLYAKYGLIPASDILSGPGIVNKSNVEQVEKLAGRYR
jgi:simple sugar transport system substrate-binding protein